VPDGFDVIAFDIGLWEDFEESPERRSQVTADSISYIWDRSYAVGSNLYMG
jgi:hypothetical protein